MKHSEIQSQPKNQAKKQSSQEELPHLPRPCYFILSHTEHHLRSQWPKMGQERSSFQCPSRNPHPPGAEVPPQERWHAGLLTPASDK